MFKPDKLSIAVVIPCHNEALTIVKVVRAFADVLPDADIVVFDNNSTDDCASLAKRAGARVVPVPLQGKSNVVRRMFADIDADVYVMVDSDDTYDPSAAPLLIDMLCRNCCDMVVDCRVANQSGAYRLGHIFGNQIFNAFMGFLFGRRCHDIFSGYRVVSRRFAKSFPAQASGFETETELTIHVLELKMPMAECDTSYR